MNVPRMTEVTLTWKFGGYNTDIYESNPEPPVVADIEDENRPAVIQQVQAVLAGSEGKMVAEIAREPMVGEVENQVRARLMRLISSGMFSSAGELGGKRDLFTPELLFRPRNGVNFTETAQLLFQAMMMELLSARYSSALLPVPQVTNRDFWLIGESRVPFGAALAMDHYLDGMFRKIREAYVTQGNDAANRVLLKARRLLEKQTPETDIPGAELLFGWRDRHSDGSSMIGPEFCCTLFIDGWWVIKSKSGGHRSQELNIIRDKAKKVIQKLAYYGLTETRFINGLRIRYTTRERVACNRLEDRDLLLVFLGTLARAGIRVVA